MGDVKTLEFERRAPGDDIFWVQDAKTDTPLQAIVAGCMATSRYQGITATLRILEADGTEIIGEVTGFEPPQTGPHRELHVGDKVRLSPDHIISCGCSIVT